MPQPATGAFGAPAVPFGGMKGKKMAKKTMPKKAMPKKAIAKKKVATKKKSGKKMPVMKKSPAKKAFGGFGGTPPPQGDQNDGSADDDESDADDIKSDAGDDIDVDIADGDALPPGASATIPAGRVKSWIKEHIGGRSNLSTDAVNLVTAVLQQKLDRTLNTAVTLMSNDSLKLSDAVRAAVTVSNGKETLLGASAGVWMVPDGKPATTLPRAPFRRIVETSFSKHVQKPRFTAKGLVVLQQLTERFLRDVFRSSSKVNPKRMTVMKRDIDAVAQLLPLPFRIASEPVERVAPRPMTRRSRLNRKK
eukprot:TRINITY_DN12028_c3_g1_i1.p1 TRINITY_DN12028_c3_g1~~TRINITY_DN12028_c3_g1_i1.p1  ORF type:complete len:351 (+),score=63.77 TRINITY_DN12028_c3_g1_i1:137-1054(+)